jgi:hypothetical protein
LAFFPQSPVDEFEQPVSILRAFDERFKLRRRHVTCTLYHVRLWSSGYGFEYTTTGHKVDAVATTRFVFFFLFLGSS